MRMSDWSSDVCSSDLRRGHLAPRQRFEPAISVGVETKGIDVDTKLARGRDLVDILAAGSRAREELLADRVVGAVSHAAGPLPPAQPSPMRCSWRGRAARRLTTVRLPVLLTVFWSVASCAVIEEDG